MNCSAFFVSFFTLLLLSACTLQSTPETRSVSEANVIAVDAADTRGAIALAHGAEVVVWRPEAGFAILATDVSSLRTTSSEQLAKSGALRAWGGALRAWGGALRAWGGGDRKSGGAVLEENAAIWDRLSLEDAHQDLAPKLGKGVRVAVIDTGLDTKHSIFAGRLDERSTWRDFVDDDALPEEVRGAAYGHGTAVASVVLQLAPNATLMPLRVLNEDGLGRTSDVAAAIDWAVSEGADVIQLSLGTKAPEEVIETMVTYAASRGVYVVASAGNHDSEPTYPAASAALATPTGEMTVGVGSVNLDDQKSSFSNFFSEEGAEELVSFGEGVYAAFPGERIAAWDGTSLAAPMVAGALALAIGEGAEASNRGQLAAKVVASATEIDAEGASGGREYELEQRLEVSQFLCSVLSSVSEGCSSDGGDDDGGDDDDDGYED